jgi:hypothetical protein
MTCGLALVGTTWLCRLYRSDKDRCRLLTAIAIAVGLVLLNAHAIAHLVLAVGEPLVTLAHVIGWHLGPYALLAGVVYGGYRLACRLWTSYPEHSGWIRSTVIAGSLAVGLFAALLLRAAPVTSEFAGATQDATAAGVRSAFDALLDRLGGAT